MTELPNLFHASHIYDIGYVYMCVEKKRGDIGYVILQM